MTTIRRTLAGKKRTAATARLRLIAGRTAAVADKAKDGVRAAKLELKEARRAWKLAKKAAKEARKRAEAAEAAPDPAPARGTAKARGREPNAIRRRARSAAAPHPATPAGPKKVAKKPAKKSRPAALKPKSGGIAARVARAVISRLDKAAAQPPPDSAPAIAPTPPALAPG